jgi:glycosyltransferase involved in cell wall biosynthesis
MKIIHIIGNMGPGGAEKLLLETLPLYKKRGIICDLLVLNGINYPFMESLKEIKCCNIHSLGIGSIYNPLLIFRIIPFLKEYDIAHVHLFPAQYWVVFAKAFSFCKTKLVLTEHSSTNDRLEVPFFNIFDKLIYRMYSKTICISENILEIMLNYTKLSRNKLVLIHNGINLEKIYNANPYKKKEISPLFSDDDKILIQIARFNKYKDHRTLIKSLIFLPKNIKLILVGEGELKSEIEKLIYELDLNKRVTLLGVRMDVPNLIKSSDISILSSHSEGFGLVAIEGMASGKPFVGSNVNGLSKIVSGAGILFKEGNDVQLSEIIKKLFEDKTHYDETVNTCLIRAKEYDIFKMVDKHIELYKSLFTQKNI